jgi:hypothetical protein
MFHLCSHKFLLNIICMKKNVKKLLAVLLALCIVLPCLGKKVSLKKKGDGSWTRSLVMVTTIEADYDENSSVLSLGFYEDFGTVYIGVSDASGYTIYGDYVDAYSSAEFSIPLDNLADGEYVLSIVQADGTAIEGEFEVEQ